MRHRVLFAAWPRFDAAEIKFWRDLRDAFLACDLILVLGSANEPPRDLDIEHVVLSSCLDAFWPGADPARSQNLVGALGLDPGFLLERETAWSGPAIVGALGRLRRTAMETIAGEQLRMLEALNPVATVIWNGQHVTELILAAASRAGGTPVMYVERAPITDALFADEVGLSSASRIAAARPWPAPPPQWRALAASISREIVDQQSTWWEQPARRRVTADALRSSLGIPVNACVVLFAGQVDQDTQQFLFSPRHTNNLDAFRWLLEALSPHRKVYVLGKQHPRSRTAAARYVECLAASGLDGAWRSDIAIADALAMADRVAAVNSTVLYEAIAHRRPALAMGDWLLRGQGAAYETSTDPQGAVDAWMNASDFEMKLDRFHEALGYLLCNSVYAFDPAGARSGMLGAADLAARVARKAAVRGWSPPDVLLQNMRQAKLLSETGWVPGDPDWPARRQMQLQRFDEWHRVQCVRSCLLPVVEAYHHRRRVIVWGTGEAGRRVAATLAAAGVQVEAFVTSDAYWSPSSGAAPASTTIRRQPICDFVVVATQAHDQVTPKLDAMSFIKDEDYVVAATWPAIDAADLMASLLPARRAS